MKKIFLSLFLSFSIFSSMNAIPVRKHLRAVNRYVIPPVKIVAGTLIAAPMALRLIDGINEFIKQQKPVNIEEILDGNPNAKGLPPRSKIQVFLEKILAWEPKMPIYTSTAGIWAGTFLAKSGIADIKALRVKSILVF